MGTRSVTAALCISLLFAGGAAFCYARAEALQAEGRWLMARGSAQASDFAQKLDGTSVDAQLKTFKERRGVMEKAHRWQRGMLLGIMAAVLSGLSAYVLFLLKRLDDQLLDATGELRRPQEASSLPTPAFAPSVQR
ncbi:hypothetical protein D7X30_27580 [Corallococcus sp. AB011P]|uniref:hypothetical protein n=1 Tax=unclassified Corallococcus TaxID=2685029 RepID=UPI000EA1ECA9|nr:MULTISPECIES: hypothetical protein [unclassified Corallococcus]RKG54929.1 hypothetical protein D7X30_27580 [Corallococcus sp. AB011P]RKH85256.1 hypothetical protein D7Y21_23265 [Corallococcus sp. AB045]